MEQNLKQRLVGALVLMSLAVIFLPLAFDRQQQDIDPAEYAIPEKPAITIVAPDVEPVEKAIQKEYAPIAQVAHAKQEQAEAMPAEPAPAPVSAEPAVAQASPAEQTRQYLEQEKAADAALQGKPVSAAVDLADAWVIQVGAFSSDANARRLQDTLKNAGYVAFVKSAKGSSGTLYKVYVGPEIRRAELERQKSALERQHNLKTLILKYIP